MSSEVALTVKGLAKRYYIYDKPHRRLLQMLLARTGRRFYREFVALQDISFTVPKGKVVGILGKNGAGKSTLLQIICGTLTPSDGTVEVRGRVAALLELGSGFNPEFTGIENIYLNGQILGLSREEVDAKLADILAFADIGDFVHQPVKTYSSGMFARLAFSVAVNVEPDLLIVDEALSVGDAWFQHKSMARMRQLMESGCSVLFVSHSIDAVRALCDEAIWLEQGRVKMQGNVTDVTNAYMNDVFIERNRIQLGLDETNLSTEAPTKEEGTVGSEQTESADIISNIEPENPINRGIVSLQRFAICDASGKAKDALTHNEAFQIVAHLKSEIDLENINIGYLITDTYGQQLVGGNLLDKDRLISKWKAGRKLTVKFLTTMRLRGGQSYSISLRITQGICKKRNDMIIIALYERAAVVEVLSEDEPNWIMFHSEYQAENNWEDQ